MNLTIILHNFNDTSDDAVLWTLVAAIAAVLSAIFAFRSNKISRNALKLATKAYNDRQSSFSLYLIDGYRCTTRLSSNRRFLIFYITIKNKSDNKNSFKAELEIEYVRADQSVARAIIAHDCQLVDQIPQKNLSIFGNDIRIDEKCFESKWLVFKQPVSVFREYRIEKYSIRLTDAVGKTEFVDAVILKELNDEKENSN